ncbi:hypothetical protein CHISP_2096 [Chitinispirillum alkaliphilum]|nr:hypothetical protein CHISP_2096 [Chitinispirillum alkaliphilum]
MPDMSYGIKLVVNCGFEEHDVHLGPAWYILFQDMNINIKDDVEVRGTRVSTGGKVFIMTSTLRKDDRILLLRDEDGIPFWCAWRRR